MIHTIARFGLNLVLDVESGAIHLLDALSFSLIPHITQPMPRACPEAALRLSQAAPEETQEAWAELHSLYEQGMLFAREPARPALSAGPLKALCLHVSHDCNMRCGYCFAGTGRYGGARALMDERVGRQAVDLLIRESQNRVNLEVDFFGGEPTLNMDMVRSTVAYGRRREAETGKRFRFTMTTNALALTNADIAFINDEMDNLVLSLDGRPDVNDALRKTQGGTGSYAAVLPNMRRILQNREKEFYVRGTFTARSLDFDEDVRHLVSLGFAHISMEPVVLPQSHPLAIQPAHLPAVFDAYDRLAETLREEPNVQFFHFQTDLSGEPCLSKRLRGCGAGFEYAAVTPDGSLYPCHQFAGREEYRLGDVVGGLQNQTLSRRFASLTVLDKPACRACWAKYFCSGGCAAASVNATGRLDEVYAVGCEMQKKRLSCALAMQAVRRAGVH